MESLGSEGKVEEAQGVMKLVDQLKEEKETLVQMVSSIKRKTMLATNLLKRMKY